MTNIDGMLKREIKASDAVVDGLFRGVLAGLGMGVYLALAGLAYGESPLGVLGRNSHGLQTHLPPGLRALGARIAEVLAGGLPAEGRVRPRRQHQCRHLLRRQE